MAEGDKSVSSIDTNEPVDYSTLTQIFESYDEYGDQRFQKFSEREFKSDHSPEMVKHLFHGKYQTRWCDVLLMKGATDLITYQQMMQEIRFRTIIETGTWKGASAAWFGDMAKNFGFDCHVYSMDIMNPDAIDKRCHRDNVTFLQGDNYKIDETFTPKMLQDLPHPWLMVEDAHVNVVAVMEHFAAYMVPGDYIIKEDVSADSPNNFGMGLIKEKGWECIGDEPYKSYIEGFMKRNSDKFLVDRKFCDMFGYNGNNNWNAYLKRV